MPDSNKVGCQETLVAASGMFHMFHTLLTLLLTHWFILSFKLVMGNTGSLTDFTYYASILEYWTLKTGIRKTFMTCFKIWVNSQNRSSHRRFSIKKDVLTNFAKFTGKNLCQNLIKLQARKLFFRPATLLKKRLWHRCFPVNISKFERTLFLKKTSGRLLHHCITYKFRRQIHRFLQVKNT